MKIYQKSGDKNVGSNVVYAARTNFMEMGSAAIFSTKEAALNPVVKETEFGLVIENAMPREELRARFMAGNMLVVPAGGAPGFDDSVDEMYRPPLCHSYVDENSGEVYACAGENTMWFYSAEYTYNPTR